MKLGNRKGAALVEMAIVIPLLFFIVLGICEFGRALFIKNALNNAAREGARMAAVMPKPINVDTLVTSRIPFDTAGLVIATSTSSLPSGDAVTVTVTLPFKTVTGLIPMLDGTTIMGEATMRYEL